MSGIGDLKVLLRFAALSRTMHVLTLHQQCAESLNAASACLVKRVDSALGLQIIVTISSKAC